MLNISEHLKMEKSPSDKASASSLDVTHGIRG